MGSFLPIGERLTEERKRLGYNQTDFAALVGITRKTLFGYESGERAPDAGALAAWAGKGLDVIYVVLGQRAQIVTNQSYGATSPHMTGNDNPVTNAGEVPLIDGERLARIVDLLEAYASQAGRRWPAKRLVAVAAEVYNVLADEPALDEPKVERILKLVVNR